ncbi:MAG: hypothetical protein LBB63_01410 [Holosporaceae bacterium]|jgi:hypothetical protein|nr:hypothetical protein [Holosporaceae bacterium]
MKKVLMASLLAVSLPVFGESITAEVDDEGCSCSEKECGDPCRCKGKNAFAGWYGGGGVALNGLYGQCEVEQSVFKAEQLAVVYAGALIMNNGIGVLADLQLNGFPLGTVAVEGGGAGGAAITSINVKSVRRQSAISSRSENLGACLCAGWGGFVSGNCYVGIEGALDVGASKSHRCGNSSPEGFGGVVGKSSGWNPTICLIHGFYVDCLSSLVYIKGGVGYSRYEVSYGRSSARLSCLAPVAGLGVRWRYGEKCFVCLEGEYVFQQDKKMEMLGETSGEFGTGVGRVNVVFVRQDSGRIKGRRCGVRMMVGFQL